MLLILALAPSAPAQQRQSKIYNTTNLKLMEGKPLVGGTVSSPDPNMYCAMANAGFDYTWIEMQHSPLTYEDVARMIYACRGSSAMPFIRVPDATEGDIQKATDIGALGIIVPTVDTVEKAQAAVKWRGIRQLDAAAWALVNTASCGGTTTGRPPTTTWWW